jgi:hypothetical protein
MRATAVMQNFAEWHNDINAKSNFWQYFLRTYIFLGTLEDKTVY